MWLTNVVYENRVIEDEQLEFKDKDALYYIGRNLTFRRCTVTLRVPARRLLLREPRFIDCDIVVKTELKNFSWDDAYLKGCRLTGRFTGNDFGRWPSTDPSFKPGGGIEDCDFTQAHLNGCRFFGCDANTLRFPRWPYFTILEPYRRAQELAALPWPGQLSHDMSGFAEWLPSTTSALTRSATTLAKQWGTTEEAIRAVLETLDGVIY